MIAGHRQPLRTGATVALHGGRWSAHQHRLEMPRTLFSTRLQRAPLWLIAALLFTMASWLSTLGQTVPQMLDGIVRSSHLADAREAYLPIIWPISHAANLLALPDGDLLCFWFTGTEEGSSGVSIAMSLLAHGSARWTRPVILARNPGRSDQNPVPFRSPDGLLWLFYTSQEAGKGQTTAVVYKLTSSDQGHTWTAPAILFSQPGTFIRQHLVVFHEKWLFPTYHSASPGIIKNAQNDVSIVRISDDDGKRWNACEVPDSDGLVQMDIVPLSTGQLIAFFRSRYADWIYRSHSTDGCHWSSPLPTQLPNNNASIQLVRLRDGHLVLAFNNIQASPKRTSPCVAARNILSIALSTDGGNTWPWVRDVEAPRQPSLSDSGDDSEYSYPSVAQTPDGTIQMAFTFQRQTIKYLSFHEDWIKHGATAGLYKPPRDSTSGRSSAMAPGRTRR